MRGGGLYDDTTDINTGIDNACTSSHAVVTSFKVARDNKDNDEVVLHGILRGGYSRGKVDDSNGNSKSRRKGAGSGKAGACAHSSA